MKFIHTCEGIYYPIDRIEKIKIANDGSVRVSVFGSWAETDLSKEDLGFLTSHIVVPAERYQLARYECMPEDDPAADFITLEPVVALAFQNRFDPPIPLTAAGYIPFTNTETWRFALVFPDGRFQTLEGVALCNTAEGFMKHARKRMAAEQERERKREEKAAAPAAE